MRRSLCSLAVVLTACGSESDVLDAGGADAGLRDAAVIRDAGRPDAGESDAGEAPVDAGEADAGAQDAGPAPLDCSGATLRALSTDTATTGPWAVGARTATIAGIGAEVWYPAAPDSPAGQDPIRYDIRDHLPASERGKISDAENPWQPCDCYRDLPIDADHGPYPVILFVHGTAGFRTQSLAQLTHWASRGFVVIAADHPGLMLQDLLGLACGGSLIPQDVPGDLEGILSALDAPSEDLAFLAGRVDVARLGMAGHSAGGRAIRGFGDRAAVLAPLASGGTELGAALRSTLVMAADQDQVVDLADTVAGYAASPSPKRLVTLAGTGHLAFSSLCSLRNAQGQNLVEIGSARDVCGVALAGRLFDCDPSYLPDPEAWRIIGDATSAAFEAVLHCRPEAADRISTIEDRYGEDIAELQEDL